LCGFTDSGSRFDGCYSWLTPTTGNAIKIEFTEFATEQDYDFLEIYNGPTTSPFRKIQWQYLAI
jgi:hypothetical protein